MSAVSSNTIYIEVDAPENCPNLHCNIHTQHTYTILPLANTNNLETLHLARDNNMHIVNPSKNFWVVTTKPSKLLRNGQLVHLNVYGDVVLQLTVIPTMKDEVVQFDCADPNSGNMVAHVVIKREWVTVKWDIIMKFVTYLCH